MTAVECAARAGVTPPVWSRWENNDTTRRATPFQPQRKTVETVARGLGVTLEEALAAAGYVVTDQKSEYSELFDGLSPSQRRLLYSATKAFREAILSTGSVAA